MRCVPLIGQTDGDLSSHLKGGYLWMLKHKYLMHQREFSKTASHPDGKVSSRKAKDTSEVYGKLDQPGVRESEKRFLNNASA
ncbi:hypothetical protein Q8A67_001094 [Cirrhinus molitorella]|uniref:Uncharacterized protein n=1 Tax=Cirrhinus molitorella TaxID=172907 RepID=A0AA88U0S3_9TELE|nr:hypothetical protein Q8A67_001094 [Cirrhinus molitorella]